MGSRKAKAPRRWAWVAGLTFVALLAVPVGTSAAVEVESGESILVFVAHPDDDIITAAGVTMDHLDNGTGEVTVAIMTNGDRCETPSETGCDALGSDRFIIGTIRQGEAVTAQSYLGTVEQSVVFFGYPNGYLNAVRLDASHLFPGDMAHTETYATRGLNSTDWHDTRTGLIDEHGLYTSQELLDDASALIASYKPDHIFTHSRWDRHQDHQASYYTLIDAVKIVQGSDPSYDPYIHTTIVHVTDEDDCPSGPGCDWNLWPALPDPSSPTNEFFDLGSDTDNELVWDQRESFEVPATMQTVYSGGTNEKANAIEAHDSQVADGGYFIRRFAHSDEVFWVEKLGAAEGRPDAYVVTEGGSISPGGSGVLSNDVRGIGTPAGAAPGQDPAPLGPMRAELVTGPQHAVPLSFTLNADGSFAYAHNGDEEATDSFTYFPAQGSTDGSATTVTITVNPVNDAPTAVTDSYSVAKGATLNVEAEGVLGNDSDPEDDGLSAFEVTGAAHGSLSLNPDGSFTYTHGGGTGTSDSFTYKANDGQYDSNTVTVSLTITHTTEDLAAAVTGPTTGATTEDITFTADVTGGEGSRSYSWSALFEGTPVDTGTDPSFTFADDDAGSYVIELTVTDSTGSVVDSQDLKLLGDIAGSPFVGDIIWLADEGITKGCNPPVNDMFCPNDRVTRGQMAAFLVRFLGLTDDGGGDLFEDDNGSIFESNIDKLATAGITRGCNPGEGNTKFCPNDYVTRGQMAAFLVRAFGLTDNGGGNLFVDDDGTVFESNIDKLATAGITRGCNAAGNEFCPNSFVTRGQMAAFLHRADGL
ncbi:MAG: hypothetical protein GY722_18610 [bacterium]|nr:hypothetical protein [bacterium]